MKNIVYFILIIFFLGMNSCGVSKQDYEKLKTERDELLIELDLYRNGEARLLAIIDQNVKNGDLSSARKNITILNQYHPESMNKTEIKELVTIVENEEAKIARIAAEREAAEKAAALERQRGFNNPQAATARVIDVVEADFFEYANKLNNGEYVIIRPGYYSEQSGDIIYIHSERNYSSNRKRIGIRVNELLKINPGTRVSVLAQVRYGETIGGRRIAIYYLSEIQTY